MDLEYDLEEINDKWRAKNIIIEELIENSIPESITVPEYSEAEEKLISYGYHHIVMKIMLNNDESIKNIRMWLFGNSPVTD